MFKFNRIGNKLGIAGALGILLALSTVVNQQMSSSTVTAANRNAANQQQIAQYASSTEASMRRMQIAVRDIRLARTQPEVDKAIEQTNAVHKVIDSNIDSAIKLAINPENKDRFQKIKIILDNYAVASNEFAKIQTGYFQLLDRRAQATIAWTKAMQSVLALPAMMDPANRTDVALKLGNVEALFQEVRAATWRFSATGEEAQKQQITVKSNALLETVAEARSQASGKSLIDAINGLNGTARGYLSIIDETVKSEEMKAAFIQQRTLPLASQSAELLGTAVSVALKTTNDATVRSMDEIEAAGRIGLVVGIMVALVLLGSMLFSFIGVSRPLTRLNGAMEKMARGQLDIDIPGTSRGDEIGDMAKTITVIRQNAEREAVEKQAAVHQEEAQRAAQRKRDMIKLADDFEGAVGEIINTVSSASTELEASASTLTTTADRSQKIAVVVAAASEEASANVQSVAAATEEMSSTVNEIGRQVQESARIASEAVEQARATNARVSELSEAASRIGDVVELITVIAGQTNLLALNATIEAARAGDAGRGFAVVASEVKALAEQTAKATGEISQQITGIQNATAFSVTAIKEIGGTIGKMSEISAAIAAAVEEQGTATQEIARNVQQAAQGTQEVSSNIVDVQRGTSETGSASSQVLSAAQSLSQDSNRLKLEVGRFLSTVRSA